MQLFFDQNISYKIIKKISLHFPGAKQVREQGLENLTDLKIWEFAKDNGFVIVTFDADFYDLSNLFGHPPKIIWLRTGNRKTDALANLIISKHELINEFLFNKNYQDIACIEIE